MSNSTISKRPMVSAATQRHTRRHAAHTRPERTMKYLCLIYSDESQWPRMPRGDAEKMTSEYMDFTKSIKESGKYVAGERLQPTSTATTVRIRGGKLATTDGPFAETKE